MCPAEWRERSRRSAGNTKQRKTFSQQKVTRIKRFWSKHFRPRNKTIFTEYDRKKSRLSSVNIILYLCLKSITSQARYVPAFLLGTSLANLCAPWWRRVLVQALLPVTRRNIYISYYISSYIDVFHMLKGDRSMRPNALKLPITMMRQKRNTHPAADDWVGPRGWAFSLPTFAKLEHSVYDDLFVDKIS